MRLRFKDIKALRGKTAAQKLFHATEAYMTQEEQQKYKEIVYRKEVESNGAK